MAYNGIPMIASQKSHHLFIIFVLAYCPHYKTFLWVSWHLSTY